MGRGGDTTPEDWERRTGNAEGMSHITRGPFRRPDTTVTLTVVQTPGRPLSTRGPCLRPFSLVSRVSTPLTLLPSSPDPWGYDIVEGLPW